MTRSLVLGAFLGFFSGIVPGPSSAPMAATALKRGCWTGFRVALVPLVPAEVAVLALTAACPTQLPESALGWMGMAGGNLVVYLAWRTFPESRKPPRPRRWRGRAGGSSRERS